MERNGIKVSVRAIVAVTGRVRGRGRVEIVAWVDAGVRVMGLACC